MTAAATTTEDAARGPLDGIRVLDLTSVVMGPLGTRILGDLGADVIVVESGYGDRNRAMGPGPHRELSGVTLNLMRNKRGVNLDLKQPSGKQACLDLAASCDVFVTNLRPGPLERLGLHYEAIKAVRDDVVFCSAHGYPSDSEMANAPAYDDIVQAASGVGDLFHKAGHEPTLVPTIFADKVSGMAIANAVLAALFHRERTGRGQKVEIPMVDTTRAFLLVEHGAGAIPEPQLSGAGYPRILTTERRPRPTADGWINLLPYDREHYEALFTAGGRDDLVDDERVRTGRNRILHSTTLYRDVAEILPHRTTDEWLAFCDEHGIPASRTVTLDEIVDELPMAEHPLTGPYRVIPPAERFSETPQSVRRPAPLIGEHGRDVLAEIGYGDDRLDELEQSGALGIPSTRSTQD